MVEGVRFYGHSLFGTPSGGHTKGRTDCHTSDVGHWFAMTVEKQTLRNHPTSDYKSGWLFYKCYEFAAVGAVSMSPAEAVLARSVSALHGGGVLF